MDNSGLGYNRLLLYANIESLDIIKQDDYLISSKGKLEH